MKTAIITIHGYFNHGNRLQNYALQTALRKLGAEVSTWVVRTDGNPVKRCANYFTKRVNDRRQLKSRKEMVREKNFKAFSDRYIETRFFYEKDGKIPRGADADTDVFVVGSDQVWNPLFWWDGSNSMHLHNCCLAFTDKKKVSYAASFGIPELPEAWQTLMAPLLSDFDVLSVREQEGRKILQEMGCACEVVLDPTMLLTAGEWREVESAEVGSDENYALVFFLGKQPETVKQKIREEAQKAGQKVIDLMDPACPYYTKGPGTFVELIDKAAMVYTDSFHASVFSILFHRPFAVFARQHANRADMSSRITTLLSSLELDGRISNADAFAVIDDFADVDKKLAAVKARSIQFLADAIAVRAPFSGDE